MIVVLMFSSTWQVAWNLDQLHWSARRSKENCWVGQWALYWAVLHLPLWATSAICLQKQKKKKKSLVEKYKLRGRNRETLIRREEKKIEDWELGFKIRSKKTSCFRECSCASQTKLQHWSSWNLTWPCLEHGLLLFESLLTFFIFSAPRKKNLSSSFSFSIFVLRYLYVARLFWILHECFMSLL